MTPPRGGRPARALGQGDLSDRDGAVLGDLARVRLLTGRHIQRLHVGEGSSLTQARRTRSLLQRLNDMEVVHRLERRIGGLRAGSSGFIYGLAPRGQRIVSGHGPAGGKRLRRPWESSRWFVEHVLAVSELFVALQETACGGAIELLTFEAEPASWRRWHGPSGERLIVKPDAFVVIGRADYEYASFVEVDRSTESLSVIRRKALVYIAYWRAGNEQRAIGIFPLVVWLVPNERRKSAIVEVLSALDPETWQLFRVGLFGKAVPLLSGDQSLTKGEQDGTTTKH
jgi:hypothetical protein